MESVTFGWKDNGITDSDRTTLNDFSDESASIVECFLEALFLSGKLAWSLAWVAVLYSMKAGRTNLKVSTNEPHELDPMCENVSSTFFEFKPAPFKEEGIHESNLALASVTPVEASVTGSVAIAL